MKQVDRIWAANRLFDAMGEIDDRWIAEAERAYTPARGLRFGRRSLIVAVTLCLVTVSVLGVLVANRSKDASPEAEHPAMDEDVGTVATFSERMSQLKGQTTTLRVSTEELDLFSGSAQVIWKYRDETDYRAKAITRNELDLLLDVMDQNEGTSVGATDTPSTDLLEGVWIAYGDGTVISPCLKLSDGNVGYGDLFAYEPELEPSDVFVNTLCGIIS